MQPRDVADGTNSDYVGMSYSDIATKMGQPEQHVVDGTHFPYTRISPV